MSVDLSFLDDIRDAVNSPGTADPELLREASIAYHDGCRDVNVRLRAVDRLLKNGLRTEAIQLAEQEPVLLDLVADLDFPLLEEWQGMLAQWGMQLPPTLERDIASRLNTAYAELQPLEQLMRRHRLLALARAPLSARIEVLRQIMSVDDLNLSWKVDLLNYERQRLQHIRTEAVEAGTRNDLGALAELHDEVVTARWLCEVPQDIANAVEQAYRKATIAHARDSLTKLAPELDRAYSEFDILRATELADRWSTLAATADLGGDDPLAQGAREALDWVYQQREAAADQQSFQASVHRIEAALERHKPAQELENVLHKAERFGLPVPEQLRSRLNTRLDALRLQSRRRSALIGAVASIVAVIATGSVIFYWRSAQGRDLTAQHVERLTQLVNNEQWTQADEYYQKLPLSLQQEPELIALHTKNAQGTRTESERAAMVADLLDRAEQMDPGAADSELLRQIREAAKTPEEKRRLAVVELNVRRKKQEQQQTIDEAFLATIKQWTDRIAELEHRDSLDDVDLWNLLELCRSDLGQHSRVTSSLRSRGEILASKLRAIIDQKDAITGERKALQTVFSAIGRPADYRAALEKLVESQPNTTAASHARQVLDDQKAWESFVEWASFWETRRDSWPKISPEQAKNTLKSGDELLGHTLKNDLSRAFEDRKAHLESIVARQDVDMGKLKSLIIQNPLTNGVWLVINDKGERYYCPKKPTKNGSQPQWEVEYFTDYSETNLRTFPESSVKSNQESPQSVYAKAFSARLAALSNENWDKTFYDVAVEVRRQVESDPSLDEILAMDMLRRILQAGCNGSHRFKQAFSQVVDDIENSGVDLSVAWFRPSDKDADMARRDARAVIMGLTDFALLVKKTADIRASHCLPPRDQISWIAALDRRRDDTWVCQPPLPRSASGSLLVATKSSSGEATLIPIAEVKSGEVNWMSPVNPTAQLIGAPVFLRQSSANSR